MNRHGNVNWDKVREVSGWWDEATRLAVIDIARTADLYYRPDGSSLYICLFCDDVWPDHDEDCPVRIVEWLSEKSYDYRV